MFLEQILKKILGDSFEKTSFLYTPYSFIVILYSLEMPEQAVISRNSIGLCRNLNFGRLLLHNCEFCWFLQSKNGSLATKAKLVKQALACV